MKPTKVKKPKAAKRKKLTKAETRELEIRKNKYKCFKDIHYRLEYGDYLAPLNFSPWALSELQLALSVYDDTWFYRQQGFMRIGDKYKTSKFMDVEYRLHRTHKSLSLKNHFWIWKYCGPKRYPLNPWYSEPLPLP